MSLNHHIPILCLTSVGFSLFLRLNPSSAQSKQTPQNSQSGILYGSNFAYTISAPKGWIMDELAGKSQGLSVVFYRNGETWKTGKSAVYVNVNGRVNGYTAKQAIADDLRGSRKEYPKSKITRGETLKTNDGREAPTFIFENITEKTVHSERVAYVETPTVILLITLTSKSTNDYKNALADHTKLVKSISYVSQKPTGQRVKKRQ